jgi:hypothetical protein
MSRRELLRAGFRRLALLIAAIVAGTAVASLAVGALIGTPLPRALSVGFYAMGSLALVGGFFVGNRGPARGRGSAATQLPGQRKLRWARPEEQAEAITTSALFVTVGIVLVLIGLAIDPRVQLV